MTSPLRLEPLLTTDYEISVVLPVCSETETVRQIAAWLVDHLGSHLREIIIVLSPDSNSESAAICRQLERSHALVAVHVQEDNPGLGRAVREGIQRTHGNLVLLMDSDGEMDNETVVRMLEEMSAGKHGLVVASRWTHGGGFVGYSRTKLILNWCFQRLFRILFWTELRDLTYGFKLMHGELARGIAWEGTLHEIACETTLKPIVLGIAATEVPSRWTARKLGMTKNRFFRNFRYAWMALRVWLWGAVFDPSRTRVARGDEQVASKKLARLSATR